MEALQKKWTELGNPIEDRNRGFVWKIRMTKVRYTLRRMKMRKAMGHVEIPIEVWKCLGDMGVEWLTNLFNYILRVDKMPSKWRKIILIPIYKNKKYILLYKLSWS